MKVTYLNDRPVEMTELEYDGDHWYISTSIYSDTRLELTKADYEELIEQEVEKWHTEQYNHHCPGYR